MPLSKEIEQLLHKYVDSTPLKSEPNEGVAVSTAEALAFLDQRIDGLVDAVRRLVVEIESIGTST